MISCAQGNHLQKERKDIGGKQNFCYIFVVLGEKKRICHLAKKAKYNVFYDCYLTLRNLY